MKDRNITFDKSFWKSSGWFLLIAALICCLPWLLAKHSWIDFPSGKGQTENRRNRRFAEFWYRSQSLCPKGRALFIRMPVNLPPSPSLPLAMVVTWMKSWLMN